MTRQPGSRPVAPSTRTGNRCVRCGGLLASDNATDHCSPCRRVVLGLDEAPRVGEPQVAASGHRLDVAEMARMSPFWQAQVRPAVARGRA